MSEAHPPSTEELLRNVDFVGRLARSLVRDPHRADDLSQEALLAGLRSGASVRVGLRAWLAGVVRNQARLLVRGERRRRRHESAAARGERTGSAADLTARLETQRRLVEAVRDLPEPYRSAIVARYFDDEPPRVIARRQAVPVDTVRTRLQRGLEQLKRTLDDRHGGSRRAWTAMLAGGAVMGAKAVMAAGAVGAVVGGILVWGVMREPELERPPARAPARAAPPPPGRAEEPSGAGGPRRPPPPSRPRASMWSRTRSGTSSGSTRERRRRSPWARRSRACARRTACWS